MVSIIEESSSSSLSLSIEIVLKCYVPLIGISLASFWFCFLSTLFLIVLPYTSDF